MKTRSPFYGDLVFKSEFETNRRLLLYIHEVYKSVIFRFKRKI